MFTWRGFRQGQHKCGELSWDNPFCPQVRLTSFLSSTKPEGVSWRILVSFTWPPAAVGLLCSSGVSAGVGHSCALGACAGCPCCGTYC